MPSSLPPHPLITDELPDPDTSRTGAGIGWALLAHLVPAVVTVPVVALTVNALVAAGQDVYIEGLFLLLMLLLLVLALQVLLAVGLLIGGVFAWSRGKRRLATGLGIGWLVGVAAVMLLGSCTPAAMAAFGR